MQLSARRTARSDAPRRAPPPLPDRTTLRPFRSSGTSGPRRSLAVSAPSPASRPARSSSLRSSAAVLAASVAGIAAAAPTHAATADGASPAITSGASASPVSTPPASASPDGASPAAAPPSGRAAAGPLRVAPSPDGRIGAWLVAGPFKSATNGVKGRPAADALGAAPQGVDEATLRAELGAVIPTTDGASARGGKGAKDPVAWQLASSGEGPIDVRAALDARGADLVAYAAGRLHVERAGRFYLLVGADDGVRVIVDGKPVFTHDEARPERDDDDTIALDLAAGDHAIALKLHQREGGWALHVRVVDAELGAPPGAYLELPGGTLDDARALAAKLSWVSVDRGLRGDGYHPRLTVRFPEGAPLGVPLSVRARLAPARGAGEALFDVDAGQVAPEIGELVATLPALRPDEVKIDDGDFTYEVAVAGRDVKASFPARRATREAVARADRALATLRAAAVAPPAPAAPHAATGASAASSAPGSTAAPTAAASFSWIQRGTLESVQHLRDRLVTLVQHGDGDVEAQRDEAKELDQAALLLEKGRDPYAARTGPIRRAYTSPVDGQLAEYALYVPPSYRPGTRTRYPLVVALHGLNGKPMAMIRWAFGLDEKGKDQDWEDRHVPPLPPLDAFVVAPHGHGNTMYRHLGQDDVVRAMDEVIATYPIDATRVTITGPSMGGIGAAALAFRYPDRFAAAEPLCGYHSYFVRRDIVGRPLRPWERFLAEERSNALWAWNGEKIPLYVVHGTQDLPESNSGVLIDRYGALKYSVIHEHPNLGHNVWQTTYEDLKGLRWLLGQRPLDLHPSHVRFRTARLREGDDAWVHVRELAGPGAWAEVEAKVVRRDAIDVRATGAAALSFDRDDKLLDPARPVTVTIGGARIELAPDEPIALHLEGASWKAGAARHDVPWKRGEIAGPIRDAFHAPLLFVYGADDPSQTRANEEVARAWARIRGGVDVRYPVMSDAEFVAKGEPLANDRALFLVGNARSNRVLRQIEPELPIQVDRDAIVVGSDRLTGPQLGAAFIRPNPRRADRYVVVVEGVDALGTWRSLSLPDLLPDFVVYDERVGPARGQMVLGSAMALAAGFFENDWSLPSKLADPLAAAVRPAARTERDATPYLP